MSNFIQLQANVASIIPATEEVTYDKYWIKRLFVSAESTTIDAVMTAKLVPCRDVTVNGVTIKELMPNPPDIEVKIDGMFARAQVDAEFASAVNTVFAQVKKIGIEQNIIKSE
jgi:hypothetical protein